jgi:hypothetical protein
MQIIILALCVVALTSCSSKSGLSDYSSPSTYAADPSEEPIVVGDTECDNPDEISPDGKYICAGHGAFYWLLRSEVDGTVADGPDTSSNSSSEPVQSTFTLPSFVGYTQSDVDSWKRENALQLQIHYSTAIGYSYTASCQVQGRGVILKQNPMQGSQVEDSFGTVIWLDIDC